MIGVKMFLRLRKRICPYCGEESRNFAVCCECAKELKKLINKRAFYSKECDCFTANFIYKDIVRDAILDFKFNNTKVFEKI